MRILAIAGSLRAQSSNALLVSAIAHLAPEAVLNIYKDLGDLPLFSPDTDTDSPQSVTNFRSQISEAEAVIICTPEYAYGMPGSLKNALDWLVSSASLYQKPVAAISASPSERGGDRALAWLLQTLTALDANVPAEAAFSVPFVREKLEGDRLIDKAIVEKVYAMFASLKASVL